MLSIREKLTPLNYPQLYSVFASEFRNFLGARRVTFLTGADVNGPGSYGDITRVELVNHVQEMFNSSWKLGVTYFDKDGTITYQEFYLVDSLDASDQQMWNLTPVDAHVIPE